VVGVELVAYSGSLLEPLLIGLVGSGGIIGAIVAFIKLGPERESAAISQAQGANEVLQETLEAVERQRDYWQRLYEECARGRSVLVDEPDRHGQT
jgi:hypothetical protein